jgi:lipopolysaccharide transport system permease protein
MLDMRVRDTQMRQTVELAWRLTARDFAARYRGSTLGVLWAFLTPLLTALIFTFVFSAVFRMRWGAGNVADGPETSFTLILLVGILLHAMLAETMNRAANTIVANASYVKKVVFPLGVLPVVIVMGALINTVIGFLIVLIGHLLLDGRLEPTVPLILLIVLPYTFLNLGISFLLAAFGVYLRDIGQLTGFLATALLFLSPILYPISAVPESFRHIMWLNPLTVVVEEARNVLLFGRWPHWGTLALLWLGSLATLASGWWVFRRLRVGFADVL